MADKPSISYVLLAVCTYRRPNMLKNTLESVNCLQLPENIKVEILVVDNDSEKSAFQVVENSKSLIKLKINYVAEEKRGLANARNRVLEEAINLKASHIFMFDDDEILTPEALLAHINLYENNENCIISSGIVINEFLEDTPKYIKDNVVFKKRTTKKTGQIRNSCASGNVFIPTEVALDGLRFSTDFILMGGEDGDFFRRASEAEFTIVQNTDSLIYEHVSKERSTVKYVLKRAYYNGYSGSFNKFKENKKRYVSLFYIIKLIFVFLIDIILLAPSIFLGLSAFVNCLSMCFRTYGKIYGAIKNKPINFYQKTYGN